jgi:TetR/AcrR family transcriptional repressor of nem operon
MRYPADHKDRVREQIVRAASRRFRGQGGRVAIADLMRELDLTHGGFYRHFEGKDQLFGEAFVQSVEHTRARLLAAAERAPRGREVEAIVTMYLGPAHCANAADGCPVAALTTEIARQPGATRALFDRMLLAHAAAFARFMPGRTAAARERSAMVLFAGMAGALNVARAVSDERLRQAILDQARTFYIDAFGRSSGRDRPS